MSKTHPVSGSSEITASTFYSAQEAFFWLGRKVIQLIDAAATKLSTPHTSTPVAIALTCATVFSVFKLSSFFYDVAKLDWSSGKIIKASFELVLSFLILAMAVSIATAFVLAKISNTTPSVA